MMVLRKKIIIAIDGYSSCGKSSFAKLIALQLHYLYLDSGAMYRAVALYAMRNKLMAGNDVDIDKLNSCLSEINIDFAKDQNGFYTLLNGENIEKEIRGVAVSTSVSAISKIRQVRQRLVQIQQKMGQNKGIVMDGRDIGTVVFPQAEIKVFMIADAKVRAQRRFDELVTKGIAASLEEIKANIEARDYQDIHRELSPLIQAEDSFVLDNSYMTFDEQMLWFENILQAKGLVA
jgi:cytidylate kinase